MSHFDSLKIGPHQIQVLWVGDIDNLWGDYDSNQARIRISTSRRPKTAIAETLIHEILHGIYDIYNLRDEDDEEHTVSTLAVGLTQVLQDSPELIKYLQKELK